MFGIETGETVEVWLHEPVPLRWLGQQPGPHEPKRTELLIGDVEEFAEVGVLLIPAHTTVRIVIPWNNIAGIYQWMP